MNRMIAQALLDHYDREGRELPWRGETDPYRILVSEVMLQQTRVRTVLGYYDRWLARFPDIDSLADADVDQVLKAWQGLGYYRRAHNLHRTARVVRERADGDFPRTYDGLRDLPGVGEYTAGAVASIAFGQAVPAVDGNVRRVLSRLFDEAAPTAAWLRARARLLVDSKRPGDSNQALMELGATLCVPRSPRCGRCPVAQWCAAGRAGTQDERPAKRTRPAAREVRIVLAVLEANGRVLLERRPPAGLLAGMWSLPEVEAGAMREDARPDDVRTDADAAEAPGAAAAAEVPGGAAVLAAAMDRGLHAVGRPVPLPTVGHRFTHMAATYEPWVLPVEQPIEDDGRAWVDPAAPNDLAVPVAQQKVLEFLATPGAPCRELSGTYAGPRNRTEVEPV